MPSHVTAGELYQLFEPVFLIVVISLFFVIDNEVLVNLPYVDELSPDVH